MTPFQNLVFAKSIAYVLDPTPIGVVPPRRFTDAVRNAIAEPWSSGQAEGQINRLKTLKRAMFGRAGIELLRARMLPIQ
ncbi:transposase [Methylosinus sp. C49]|uniref:transposase n=1 Tax=Methylosinus sp. C49 TaxID=2699395 RepID=UPI00137A1211|nr:transposase [Methylosinus sp. C49]